MYSKVFSTRCKGMTPMKCLEVLVMEEIGEVWNFICLRVLDDIKTCGLTMNESSIICMSWNRITYSEAKGSGGPGTQILNQGEG